MKTPALLNVNKFSIRRLIVQLTLIPAALLAFAIISITIYTAESESQRIAKNMKQQANVLVRNLSATSGDYLLAHDYTSIELSLMRLAKFPGVLNIQVSDNDGNLVGDVVHEPGKEPEARFGEPALTPPINGKQKVIISEHEMVIWQPVILGELLGWIKIVYSMDEINHVKQARWQEIRLMGFLIISVTMILLFILYRRPMNSIANYTEFAAQLNDSNGKHTDLNKSSIELEQLGNALNWASSKLHEQNKKINRAMRDLEILAAFPEMTPNIVLSINEKSEVQYMNPHARKLMHELNISEEGGINGLLPKNIDTIVNKCIDGNCRPSGIEVSYNNRTFFWTFSPVQAQKVMHGYAMEITERIKAEEKAQEARVDALSAVQANKAKSQFLANMSHELRTPLNAIIGYTELLEEEAEDMGYEQNKEDIHNILHAARHLLSLINDILDLSKVESGHMDFYFEDINIPELIESVSATATPLANKNDNKLEIEYKTKIKIIHSDKTKLNQIMFNLLGNAFKFTQQGKVTLSIHDKSENNIAGISLSVTDSGIGMTNEQISRIFKPFSQADNSTTRKYGGTGLGLAITKAYCEMLGGRIDVTSNVGEGATFCVWLPLIFKQPNPPGDSVS